MKKEKKYVIGVDGGGTKTVVALADLNGKVLKTVKTGPSNLRNLGIEKAVSNIGKGILKVIKNFEGQVIFCFIALAAVQEEYKNEIGKIKKELLKIVNKSFKGKIEIGSDQLTAFRAGTDEKDGLILISGTGAACHGWWKGKEAKVSGWGWLNDEGSGFWAGQKGFQAFWKELDGRGRKTKITKLIFKNWKIKNNEDLLKKIYDKDFAKKVSLLSVFVDKASKQGDKIAKKIMQEAGQELALAGKIVIKELGLQKQKFPLVLVGGMFKSKIVLNIVKKEIKKLAPKTKFIRPKKEPVIGAIKLALEKF